MGRSSCIMCLVAVWLVMAEEVPATEVAQPTRNYYVDASQGDDAADGLTRETAWRSLEKVNAAPLQPGDSVRFRRGGLWRGQLVPRSGNATARVTYGAFGEGAKPALLGSVAMNSPLDWVCEGGSIWATTAASDGATALSVDVGNIIFDDGASTGVKKWSRADLREAGDFFYDAAARQVNLWSSGNPADGHRSIELALKRHIIDQSGKSYATFESLALRYGAAHGVGGSGVRGIVVRDCDLSYIGGGHQHTNADGRPVRYGNGIEFWASARDCLVEGCRLWEIYDAALTNQGSGTNVQENIVYRNNVIWNCEYSFEYWNRDESSRTGNIRFEYNTCIDAGFGWGHRQRPDRNGRHLMFYDNSAATSNVVVCCNIFSNATDSLLRLHGRDWTSVLTMDYNCWHQPQGAIWLWGQTSIGPAEFDAFRRQRGFDLHSIVAEPGFVDAKMRDYRLTAGSPARGLADNGSPAGALP
ncbi:MAG TPA: hypothetical protein PKH24_02505 [Sedimentisphaerales bacterium]|nr:hypothetical protein [Sedimentisphaerales bacterium]HNU28296.1 hypothetical protein [Sedimentisphaerales bacterium]